MLLISLEKVTFSRISLEKAVKTPLCTLIFLKKHPKICAIREICERPRTLRICEICEICEPLKICEICEICEPFKTRRNPRAFQNSAKIRERNTQNGNNLRRNWFIGGCPISWRRPTLPHSHAVPSARTGLTALFGMGRGVPRGYNRHCLLKFLAYSTHINAL